MRLLFVSNRFPVNGSKKRENSDLGKAVKGGTLSGAAIAAAMVT